MKEARLKADAEIPALKPEILPAAIKQGIAPAMTIDITKPFWGGDPEVGETAALRKVCGCKPEKKPVCR